MDFLPHLDAAWRGDAPEKSHDFWFQMYEQACPEHRVMIDAEKVRCGLTIREATQKIFKCDEAFALADKIPATWNKPVFSSFTAQQVTEIVGSHTMATLVASSRADPDIFDAAILLHTFLRGPGDRQGGDAWLRKI